MSSQDVIDWIYERTDDEDYESETKLKSALTSDDTKRRIRDWIDGKGYTPSGRAVYETAIQSRIDEFVAKKEEVEEVKVAVSEYESIIARAETQVDIAELPTRGQLRRDLGAEEAQRIIDLSEEKAGELATLSEEAFSDTSSEISRVATIAGLDVVSDELDEIPHLTTSDRVTLRSQIRSRMAEFE